MKKLFLFSKKEIKILDNKDLEQLYRAIEELYSSNLIDEVLIVDKDIKLSNIDIEFFHNAFQELNEVKYNLKKLNKDVLELKEIISKLIKGIKAIQDKITEIELNIEGKEEKKEL